MFNRLFNKEIFQGNLNKKNYFEGWYFKNVSIDKKHIYSFIAGVSSNKEDKHSFVQVINGETGKTYYFRYDLSDFFYDDEVFYVTIGENEFCSDYISVNLKNEEIEIIGNLEYKNIIKLEKKFLQPNIMGPFSFIPNMECNHGIVNVDCDIEGELLINGLKVDFTGGKSYCEKDYGFSFPERWIWLQSNNFEAGNSCLFFSIAKIPVLKWFFDGFISFLYLDDKFYFFTTYNGSKIDFFKVDDDYFNITLKNKKNKVKIIGKLNRSGDLIAPVSGKMNRVIRESVKSFVEYQLFDKKDNLIFNDKSEVTGLELMWNKLS